MSHKDNEEDVFCTTDANEMVVDDHTVDDYPSVKQVKDFSFKLSAPSYQEVLATPESEINDNNKNRISSIITYSAIKEHVEKLRLKKEAELNKKKLEREDKTEPLENLCIEVKSNKIMFIISMEETRCFGTKPILYDYEFMARELGFDTIVLRRTNVRSILQSIKEHDKRISSNVSCLAFFIVTHENSIELVELSGLQKICEETSKFYKVPKLFFIEACRGGILEENIRSNKTLSDEISNINIAETIIAYSTLSGVPRKSRTLEKGSATRKSFRSTAVEETSEVIMSSFADVLCQAMLWHVDFEEFHKILTRVNNDVSRDRIKVKDKNGKIYNIKQMSSFRSSFSKRIFFTK